jgi:hypothetical protein
MNVPPYCCSLVGAGVVVVAGADVDGADVVAGAAVVAGADVDGVLAQLPRIKLIATTMINEVRSSLFIISPPLVFFCFQHHLLYITFIGITLLYHLLLVISPDNITPFRFPVLPLPVKLKKDYKYKDALPAIEITLSYNSYLLSVNRNEHCGNKIAHNVYGKTIKAGARFGKYAATSVRKRVDKGSGIYYSILNTEYQSWY